jgi:hypothetical protein
LKENPTTTDGKTPLLVSEATYDDHYGVNDAGFIINQVTPTGNRVDVRLGIFNETSDPLDYGVLDPTDLTTGTPVTIDSVTIYNLAGTAVWDETGDLSASDPASFNGANDVLNLGAGYKVIIHGDTTFERMEVLNIDSTHGFDLKGIVIESADAGDPISMNFDALLRDGDTDLDPALVSSTALATGDIDITLAPPLI